MLELFGLFDSVRSFWRVRSLGVFEVLEYSIVFEVFGVVEVLEYSKVFSVFEVKLLTIKNICAILYTEPVEQGKQKILTIKNICLKVFQVLI